MIIPQKEQVDQNHWQQNFIYSSDSVNIYIGMY